MQAHLAPAILEVDQQHLDQVLAALQHAAKQLSTLLPGTHRQASHSQQKALALMPQARCDALNVTCQRRSSAAACKT